MSSSRLRLKCIHFRFYYLFFFFGWSNNKQTRNSTTTTKNTNHENVKLNLNRCLRLFVISWTQIKLNILWFNQGNLCWCRVAFICNTDTHSTKAPAHKLQSHAETSRKWKIRYDTTFIPWPFASCDANCQREYILFITFFLAIQSFFFLSSSSSACLVVWFESHWSHFKKKKNMRNIAGKLVPTLWHLHASWFLARVQLLWQ